MKLAIIAPPFLSIPPKRYGGTELFISELTAGLAKAKVDVVLYTNAESTLNVPRRWLYEKEDWPIRNETESLLKALNHTAWAVKDIAAEADVLHLNSAPGLCLSRFVDVPVVYTVHHAHEPEMSSYYSMLPEANYVTISDFQRERMRTPRIRTIHHGTDPSRYRCQLKKQPYLSFLGRIAPPKGVHLAIEIAKKAGIPLKIAGEIQPLYQDYWERMVKPQIDGKFIEFVGEVGLEGKNELLGNSMAMLFPIEWDEPFGLVLIEAMACGTPVLAIPRGSVPEIVCEGVSGHIRQTPAELAECAKNVSIDPAGVRRYMEKFFSAERMVRDYLDLYSQVFQERVEKLKEPEVA